MKTKRRRPVGQVQADINVTPLVDVVLVLLIIFMVVTPMITRGKEVELPQTVHHQKQADDGSLIPVSVTRAGEVYVASNPVAIDDLSRVIAEARRSAPGKGVYVRGDTGAPYGTLRAVMQALHEARLEQILLGTAERR
jgi:biopolymer transport protein TolR